MSHRIENKTNILFSFNALFRFLILHSIFNLYKQNRFKINIQINIKEYQSILDDKFTTSEILILGVPVVCIIGYTFLGLV